MAIDNIKIEWDFHPEGDILIKAVHNVNGSSVGADGKTLPEALERLAQRIRLTRLADPVWQDERLK